MDDKQVLYYKYKFTLEDNTKKEFLIELDRKTLKLVNAAPQTELPQWTELNLEKCPHCTLDPAKNKYCPVAVNIINIVDFFKAHISYIKADVSIETNERNYSKQQVQLQKGVSSLMGIYMVVNDCPVMSKLKPMVLYHLPFASLDETRYRMVTLYLFAQYYLEHKGRKPDWNMKNFIKIYDDVRIVNEHITKRLINIEKEDTVSNAIVRLDCLAGFTQFSVNDLFKDVEQVFEVYTK